MSLVKRLPQKRGFVNIFRTEYSIVNLDKLNSFEPGSEITPERLADAGIVKSLRHPVKILAGGEINHPVTVRAVSYTHLTLPTN